MRPLPVMWFREPKEAFDAAIAEGVLSGEESCELFAGRYMYMGTTEQGDWFKHIETRRYVLAVKSDAASSDVA